MIRAWSASRQDPIAHLGKRIASAFTLWTAPNENPIDQLRSVGLTADDVTRVIRFLDGPQALQEKVKKYAAEVAEYTAFKFYSGLRTG